MDRRAFIFGELYFPHGSASANYVLYLAKCLQEIGYKVCIITEVNKTETLKELGNNRYEYEGIEIFDMPPFSNNRFISHIEKNYLRGHSVIKIMELLKPTSEDLVISYSMNDCEMNSVFRYCRNNGIQSAACITELLSAEQFGKGTFDFYYLKYLRGVRYRIPKANYIFPISTYIEDFYMKMRVRSKVFRMPVLSDSSAAKFSQKPKNVTRFIFPANGMMKDSMAQMLDVFSELPDDYLEKVEFHITGITEKQVEQYCNECTKMLINKSVFVHGWLEYSKLVELYQQVHFLLLLREKNQMTEANFPSKVPETMTYGIVPIASNVGDYTSIFLRNNIDSLIIDDISDVYNRIVDAIDMKQEEYDLFSQRAIEKVKELDYHIWAIKLKQFLIKT